MTADKLLVCEEVLSELLSLAPRIELESSADEVAVSIRLRESLVAVISEVRKRITNKVNVG